MRIEIDQSGKLEHTHKPTIVGFSNSTNKTLIILATEKQKLQKFFRKRAKGKQYIYTTFAILIFLLIKNERKISEIFIDREYPGQEALIKGYLLGFLRKTKLKIDKKSINFTEIGKAAKIHGIVWKAYQSKKADHKVRAQDIIKICSK